ncbi:MATE family efflux transporter [Hyphomonas atlantica]|uniref:MATE family efflux transporter n=1 Tax=Hyphomonas atlantica TaxID=1280948 RepID=UPI0032B16005
MRTHRLGWPAWARPADITDLLRLSIPIAFTRMSQMLMAVTDAIVLGQYAPGQLPYILNSWLPMGVSLGLGLGVLLGVQVLTSELLGIGREKESGRIFRRGLWTSVWLGFLLMGLVYFSADALFTWLFVDIAPPTDIEEIVDPHTVAGSVASVTRILSYGMVGFMISTVCGYYLEALRRPLLVSGVMYFGVFVNAIIDLALVAGFWGFEPMGAEGVAWATTGSRLFITVLLLVAVVLLTPALRKSPKAPADEARRQLSVGTGTAISNVAEWGGFNLTFVIATWISLAANSVYGYAIQIMGLCFMFYLGIATATSVRVAEAYGRRNLDEMRDAGRLGVAATILMGVGLGIILILFNDTLAGFLVKDDAMIGGVHLATGIAALLVMASVVTVFDGLQATASFALRAQEIVWSPSLIHIGSFFLVMLPACYWLGIVEGRGAQGMMEGVFIGVFTAGILQTMLLEWKTARQPSRRAV